MLGSRAQFYFLTVHLIITSTVFIGQVKGRLLSNQQWHCTRMTQGYRTPALNFHLKEHGGQGGKKLPFGIASSGDEGGGGMRMIYKFNLPCDGRGMAGGRLEVALPSHCVTD